MSHHKIRIQFLALTPPQDPISPMGTCRVQVPQAHLSRDNRKVVREIRSTEVTIFATGHLAEARRLPRSVSLASLTRHDLLALARRDDSRLWQICPTWNRGL